MPTIALTPSKIYSYPTRSGAETFNRSLEQIRVPSGHSRKKPELSKKAMRRIREKINWLCLLSRKRRASAPGARPLSNFQISFITLTLPAKQFHSHAVIKEKALNLFLTSIRGKFKIKNYVWKLELQKNGNAHFHLTTDVYIHYMEIRRTWNRCLKKLGYIDAYRDRFAGKSFDEYIQLASSSATPDLKKLRKSYDYGVQSGWQNPNTTDVKSVKDVKNLASYLAKYLAKPAVSEDSTPEQLESAETLTGRLWFCSQSLSALGKLILPWCAETFQVFKLLMQAKQTYKVYADYCTLAFFTISQLPRALRKWVSDKLVQHALQCNYYFPARVPEFCPEKKATNKR